MTRAIGIAIGADSFVSSLGNRLDVARTTALLYIGGDSELVLGRAAVAAAKVGGGSFFRDFTARVGDPVPLVGERMSRTGSQLVAIAVQALLRDRLPDGNVAVALAHPTVWPEYARTDLSTALARVGIQHTLVTAAAAAHTALTVADLLEPDAAVLVCDVGRSGTELSCVRRAEDVTQVTQATWFQDFGGDLVDHLLLGWVLASRTDIDPADRTAWPVLRALRVQARIAKEQLSHDVAAVIGVNLHGTVEDQRIVRSELEELVEEPVQRLALRVADLAAQADPAPTALALVGGASAMPLVAERLSAAVRLPIVTAPDPADLPVRGAVAVAGRLAAERPDAPEHSELDEPMVDAGPPVRSFPAVPGALRRRRSSWWRGVGRPEAAG